jgi:hypothetical protein
VVNEPELVATIKSRGYFTAEIRPAEYQPHRVATFVELEQIVERSQVRLRGWYFPHISRDKPILREKDAISQAVDWDNHLEIWRFYKSSQFLFIGGLSHDWRDRSGLWPAKSGWNWRESLSLPEVIFRCTESLEFASRIGNTPASGDETYCALKVENIAGRRLSIGMDNRMDIDDGHRSSVNEIVWEKTVNRPELLAGARELALDAVSAACEYFHWDASRAILRDIQRELLRE